MKIYHTCVTWIILYVSICALINYIDAYIGDPNTVIVRFDSERTVDTPKSATFAAIVLCKLHLPMAI